MNGSSPKRVVDFRSRWALYRCRFAFTQKTSASLQGLICDADPRSRPAGTKVNLYGIRFNKCHPQLLVMSQMNTSFSKYCQIKFKRYHYELLLF